MSAERQPRRVRRGGKRRARVVVAGGGVAALEAMLALRRLAPAELSVTLVTPGREFVYRPLAAAEPFGLGRVHRFDLGALTASAGAEILNAKVVGIEPDRRRVALDRGATLDYDALVVASGARPRPALPGALTFWGVADTAEVGEMLADLERGGIERVAFAAHAGSGWHLPLYELALLTRLHLSLAGVEGRELVIVTHEPEPLAVFGPDGSARVRRMLEERRIELVTGRHPDAVREAALETVPGEPVRADRVVTLPRLEGPRLAGLPMDDRGFIPVDSLGRVRDVDAVYAAGDVTSFAIKQGGIAAQQAYAAATAVAAAAGVEIEPQPFRPVLRGFLLTDADGHSPGELVNGRPHWSAASSPQALWWPPGRVAGRFLVPHLTAIAGESVEPAAPANGSKLRIEVELSAEAG